MDLPVTIPDCHALITHLLSIVSHQNKQIEGLTSRVAELEAQINQNSRNSSRPPSSDYPKIKPGIPKEQKNQGGQKGHQGNTLRKVDNPDAIVLLSTLECTCGALLDPTEGDIYQTYQVFDIPKPKLYVTEYQRLRQRCACGQIHLGVLPPDIHASVQYGPGACALTTLLGISCQLSYQKISTLFNDLYGYELNESTAISNNALAYTQLEAVENQIKSAISESEVVHFDESGVKVDTVLGWLHTACTALFTYLYISSHRGQKAHQDHTSILFTFKKWAIHDCYATYFLFKNCRHALCNPHLLRELQAQIEQGKPWAVQMHAILLALYQKSEKGTKTVPDIALEKVKWQQLCTQAIAQEELLRQNLQPTDEIDTDMTDSDQKNKKRGRKKRGKALSLLDRLLEHSDAILAFAEYAVVPFSNNQAERDIRPVKTKQKVSGCFRTMEGAKRYARIQGFISTCRKHKLNVFNELRAVCSTHIFYHAPFGAK